MKKLLSFTLAFFITILLLFSLTGCNSEEGEVRKLISNFEHSCNELDVNDILDCIDPDVSGGIKMAAGILSGLSGNDSSDIIDALSKFLVNSNIGNSNDFFKALKFNINDITIEGTKAYVNTKISSKIDGEAFEQDATLMCKKNKDKWYISDFSI